MKKTMKRVLAVLLSLVLMASVLSISAAAATQNVKHYESVTTLGDSIIDGFSMPDYARKANGRFVLNKVRIKDSYADLVADAVGAERFHPLAQCGYRTVELRMALDPSYKGDIVAKRWQPTLSNNPDYTYAYLTSQYPEYEAAIKDSALVLLDIGYNDTWVTVLGTLLNIIEETPNTESSGETLAKAIEERGSLEKVLSYVAFKIQQTPSYVQDLTTALAKLVTVSEIKENYDVIVKKIYEINPNVTIVATSTYNPFKDWSDLAVLAPIAQHLLYDKINAAKQSYVEQYNGKYIYVDDSDTEVRTKSAQSALSEGWDPHPTEAGHRYIAQQIINALPKA
ncbi:MAG: GDSL-type esterase/lipase family protein [Oscillospiraceae bacterium]|nr:GDSL-type esterase/lipase family protein [Oscillospiraceae bacterium]